VVALTLALLTSLSQWFSDGFDAFVNKRYDEAVTSLTKVIDAEVDPNPLHDVSLYWRAQCRIQQDDMDAARKDLEALLKCSPEGPLAARAAQDYRAVTGKPWAGLMLASPAETWQTLLTAIKKEDAKALEACCTGKLKAELGEFMREGEDFWAEMVEEVSKMKVTSVAYNAASNKALVMLSGIVRDSHEEERLVMTAEDGQWRLADEYRESMASEFEMTKKLTPEQEKNEKTDRERLETLRVAFKVFLTSRGRMPRRLSDLEDFVENYAIVSVSALDGRPFVLGAPPGGKPPWIFGATPYAGRRIAYIAGDVKTVPENEFRSGASEYGIRVPVIRGELDLTDEERDRLRKLVDRLGAPSFKVRREAYDALKAAGAAAREFLDKAVRHPDPEIAVRARRLLEEQ